MSALFLTACSSDTQTSAESEDRARNDMQESGVLRAATSGSYFPNSYHEEGTNELTGFEVEILREIEERLDLEVISSRYVEQRQNIKISRKVSF